MIELEIINELEIDLEEYEVLYRQICMQALKHLGIEDDIEFSVTFCSNERIHEINREYRHIDRVTDVITFALEDVDSPFIEGMPRCLGDIFISYDKAVEQANDYQHSIKRELCFLFVHGLLHLLGYDHMNEEDEKEMFTLQDEILNLNAIHRFDIDALIAKAKEATKNAYVPYSNFRVGAAVLLKNGEYILGANIENAAYGSTMCAERNAVFGAYCNGYTKEDIVALCITGDVPTYISPCGNCRQVLSELLEPTTPIILVGKKGYMQTNIIELLPGYFTPEDLKEGQNV